MTVVASASPTGRPIAQTTTAKTKASEKLNSGPANATIILSSAETGGNASQAKIHSVDFLFPDGFAKPDAESIDHQSTPTRGQVVAQLVNNNQEIERHPHFQPDNYDL